MIVLAGGIGSGKSVVARILRLKGFGVFDCDREARELMEGNSELVKIIKNTAGEDVYLESGVLNRRLLATRLFADWELRNSINTAVHSAVKERIRVWQKEKETNIFVETAIAAESGIAEMAEEIWLLEASPETRMDRVCRRDGRCETEIMKIMSAQENEEERLKAGKVKVRRILNNPSDRLLAELGAIPFLKKSEIALIAPFDCCPYQ